MITREAIRIGATARGRCTESQHWMLRATGGRTKATELADARALVKDKTDKDITVRNLISVEG
jgi:hypothetical protein